MLYKFIREKYRRFKTSAMFE